LEERIKRLELVVKDQSGKKYREYLKEG